MRKIFISAGHARRGSDVGAAANGCYEGDITAEIRDGVARRLRGYGVSPVVDDDKSALQQTINTFKALVSPGSIVLDIHLNAAPFPGSGGGVECYVPDSHTAFEVELAAALSEQVGACLQIPLRRGKLGIAGVKTEGESARGKLAWMRLVGENVLLETFFITNRVELDKYMQRKEALFDAIALVLYTFAKR